MIIRDRTLVRDLAAALIERSSFAAIVPERCTAITSVCIVDADFFVRQQVKSILVAEDCSDRWSRALAREIIEFILLDAPELPDCPPLQLVNLENGVLDPRSGLLLPHAPEFLMTVRIPLVYKPAATCPAVERFVCESFPSDSCELAWELLGDLLTPDRSIQKAICLVGGPGTGVHFSTWRPTSWDPTTSPT